MAAAEPVGDAALVWRAAGSLGIEPDDVSIAIEAGLVGLSPKVVFRHPLVRSAAYGSATGAERQAAHRALADMTDPEVDPDRRAWHRAQATSGPDEDVALELERSAARAQTRGGLAAAAAFLERSVALTGDSAKRLTRTLAAAWAKKEAGELESAMALLTSAEAGAIDEAGRARTTMMRGQIGFYSGAQVGDAPSLLLQGAKQLETIDVASARQSYFLAMGFMLIAGRFGRGASIELVARTILGAPPSPSTPPRPSDLLLVALAMYLANGPAAAAPMLRQSVSVFRVVDVPLEEELQTGVFAVAAALVLWDYEALNALASRQVHLARQVGALPLLALALANLAHKHVFAGDLQVATSLIAEAEAIGEIIGTKMIHPSALKLAALRGREPEASVFSKPTRRRPSPPGWELLSTGRYGQARCCTTVWRTMTGP